MSVLTNRMRRRVVARILEINKKLERGYAHSLRSFFVDMHTETMAMLRPRLSEIARADAHTPLSMDFDLLTAKLVAGIPQRVGPLFDRTARAVEQGNARAMRVVGIDVSDARLSAEIAKRRDENIRLVEKAHHAYAQDVRDIFEDPESHGLTADVLASKLVERGNVSQSRAELIARDQTLKLNGAITQIRQTNAGVASYVWSTSLDERVREEHAAQEGMTFAWSSPPSTGHPGEDIQCRCVAIPVIEGLEDL